MTVDRQGPWTDLADVARLERLITTVAEGDEYTYAYTVLDGIGHATYAFRLNERTQRILNVAVRVTGVSMHRWGNGTFFLTWFVDKR